MRGLFVGTFILNNFNLCVHLYKTKIHCCIQTSKLVCTFSDLEAIRSCSSICFDTLHYINVCKHSQITCLTSFLIPLFSFFLNFFSRQNFLGLLFHSFFAENATLYLVLKKYSSYLLNKYFFFLLTLEVNLL